MYLDVIAYRISTVQTFIYILVLLFTCHIHSSNLFWVQLCAKHASRCCGFHIECDSSNLYSHGVYILVPWTGWLSFLHFPFHLHNSGGHKNQLNTICAFKYFTNSGGNRQWKQIQWWILAVGAVRGVRTQCCGGWALNSACCQGDWLQKWTRKGFLEEEHWSEICRVNQAKPTHKFTILSER